MVVETLLGLDDRVVREIGVNVRKVAFLRSNAMKRVADSPRDLKFKRVGK